MHPLVMETTFLLFQEHGRYCRHAHSCINVYTLMFMETSAQSSNIHNTTTHLEDLKRRTNVFAAMACPFRLYIGLFGSTDMVCRWNDVNMWNVRISRVGPTQRVRTRVHDLQSWRPPPSERLRILKRKAQHAFVDHHSTHNVVIRQCYAIRGVL